MTEKSKEAALCSLFYEDCRDAVLADFPWRFATKRVALADLDIEQPDWQYSYRYPVDCLRIVAIVSPDGERFITPERRVPYEVGSDENGTGRLILTDLPKAWLRYVTRVTDPNMFDAEFRDALSWRPPPKSTCRSLAMPVSVIAPSRNTNSPFHLRQR